MMPRPLVSQAGQTPRMRRNYGEGGLMLAPTMAASQMHAPLNQFIQYQQTPYPYASMVRMYQEQPQQMFLTQMPPSTTQYYALRQPHHQFHPTPQGPQPAFTQSTYQLMCPTQIMQNHYFQPQPQQPILFKF